MKLVSSSKLKNRRKIIYSYRFYVNDKLLILSVNDNLQLIEENKVAESIAWELLKNWNFLTFICFIFDAYDEQNDQMFLLELIKVSYLP